MCLNKSLAELMVKVASSLYLKYITRTNANGKPVLYTQLEKAVDGMMKSKLFLSKTCWWPHFSFSSLDINPYDPCIANKTINIKQLTVLLGCWWPLCWAWWRPCCCFMLYKVALTMVQYSGQEVECDLWPLSWLPGYEYWFFYQEHCHIWYDSLWYLTSQKLFWSFWRELWGCLLPQLWIINSKYVQQESLIHFLMNKHVHTVTPLCNFDSYLMSAEIVRQLLPTLQPKSCNLTSLIGENLSMTVVT